MDDQSALARIQAARTMEEHHAEVTKQKECIECLTLKMTELEAKVGSIPLQLEKLTAELALLTLAASAPEVLPEVLPEPEVKVEVTPEAIPIAFPENAEESPVAKTEPNHKRRLNRI